MKEIPYFRFYPAEWKAGKISAFGALEQGVYLNLCIYAWTKGGRFEIEFELLAKQMEISVEKLTEIVDIFIKFKLLHHANAMQNIYVIKFVEEEFQASKHLSKIRAKSAGIRWKNQPHNDTNAMQSDAKTDIKDKDKDKDKSINNTPSEIKPGKIKQVKLTLEEKKRIRVLKNTPIMIRIGKWFGRNENTKWSIYEAEALAQLQEATADELDFLEKYYMASIPAEHDYRRRNIPTLLNNWGGEVDKAIGYVGKTISAGNDTRVFKPL